MNPLHTSAPARGGNLRRGGGPVTAGIQSGEVTSFRSAPPRTGQGEDPLRASNSAKRGPDALVAIRVRGRASSSMRVPMPAIRTDKPGAGMSLEVGRRVTRATQPRSLNPAAQSVLTEGGR